MAIAGILASSLLPASCVSAPATRPVALLQRPERPVLSEADEIREAAQQNDTLGLLKLYAKDVSALTAYARKLEAMLDAVERQTGE
ncbi:hypothetical protein P0082_01030 [Candidatus Haliotispira prima]|uniref:Uncharacterized protein n=1 Tax=Candidatus Haliotispira prima TaxID=3034016 RepID=A0ABY8MHM9_9SPIO|nr:hypothetical protein P0082_01030 [Candidatus Haliotispira prima]